jgi:two-component system, LytTR family, response regulator
MKILNCIVVDDEPIARDIIVAYCSHLPSLKVIAICSNALEAKSVLEQKATDIIFLDINMPVLNGLAFLKTLTVPPQIIFITAYRDYAVEAFDLAAADYLLKPFSLERFIVAVDKAKAKLQAQAPGSHCNTETSIGDDHSIFIKADGKIYRMLMDDILFAEASGNYSKVVTITYTILPAMSFTSFITMLDQSTFLRTHRSFIINRNHIRLIDGNRVFIKNYEVPIGQSYKEEFTRKLGI